MAQNHTASTAHMAAERLHLALACCHDVYPNPVTAYTYRECDRCMRERVVWMMYRNVGCPDHTKIYNKQKKYKVYKQNCHEISKLLKHTLYVGGNVIFASIKPRKAAPSDKTEDN